MSKSSAYEEDLAYIHDVGSTEFARGSATGLLKILEATGNLDGPVIDLGCGSGVWARELVNAGFDVIGVDISPAFIKIARERVPQAEFHAEPLLSFRFPKCRAVTALGEVLNYRFDSRNGPAALKRLCKRIDRALLPGGLFIFDVAVPERDRGRGRAFWEGDDYATLVEFDNDPVKERLTRRIVTFRKIGRNYRRREETHVLQLYRAKDVTEILRGVGFHVRKIRRYGDFPLPKSIVGFIARKPS